MNNDNVNHPSHYMAYKLEVINLTSLLDFNLGNAVKYILRAPFKGHFVEDLEKAKWYLTHEHTGSSSCVPYVAKKLAKEYNDPLVEMLLEAFPPAGVPASRSEVKHSLDEIIKRIDSRIYDHILAMKRSEAEGS